MPSHHSLPTDIHEHEFPPTSSFTSPIPNWNATSPEQATRMPSDGYSSQFMTGYMGNPLMTDIGFATNNPQITSGTGFAASNPHLGVDRSQSQLGSTMDSAAMSNLLGVPHLSDSTTTHFSDSTTTDSILGHLPPQQARTGTLSDTLLSFNSPFVHQFPIAHDMPLLGGTYNQSNFVQHQQQSILLRQHLLSSQTRAILLQNGLQQQSGLASVLPAVAIPMLARSCADVEIPGSNRSSVAICPLSDSLLVGAGQEMVENVPVVATTVTAAETPPESKGSLKRKRPGHGLEKPKRALCAYNIFLYATMNDLKQ
jgi:hypothetical protein